jgi:hypothetical protein
VSERDLKEVRRADEAKRLLENPVYEEAWEAIRQRLLLLMETAQTDEGTLKAKLALGLLTDLKLHWTRIIGDGAVAAQSIKIEEQKRKWYQRAA